MKVLCFFVFVAVRAFAQGPCIAEFSASGQLQCSEIRRMPSGDTYEVFNSLLVRGLFLSPRATFSEMVVVDDPFDGKGSILNGQGVWTSGRVYYKSENGLHWANPVFSEPGNVMCRGRESIAAGGRAVIVLEGNTCIKRWANAVEGYDVLFTPEGPDVPYLVREESNAEHFVVRTMSGRAITFSYFIFASPKNVLRPTDAPTRENVAEKRLGAERIRSP